MSALRLPTSLTSLRLRAISYRQEVPPIQMPFPPLSSIAWDNLYLTPNLSAVFSASAASLTALNLSSGLFGYDGDHLQLPHCPSLTSFSARFDNSLTNNRSVGFVRQHATQLRHLAVTDKLGRQHVLTAIVALTFPALTSLSLAGIPYTALVVAVASNLHHFPALDLLSLSCVMPGVAMPPPPGSAVRQVAPLLTSLSHSAPTTEFYADLLCYTRLRRLALPAVYQTYQYLQGHRSVPLPEIRFPPLKATTVHFVQEVYSLCGPQATSVVFDDAFSYAHLLTLLKPACPITLPRLRKLTIDGHFTPAQLAQAIGEFRCYAPALSRLHVRLQQATVEGITLLCKACQGLEYVRMRLLSAEFKPTLCAEVEEMRTAWAPLCVRLREELYESVKTSA